MVTLINNLKKLKEKILKLKEGKISYRKFDEGITKQIVRNDIDNFYHELVYELGIELELMDISKQQIIKDKPQPTEYPKKFIDYILKKINKKIRSLENKNETTK